MRDIPEFELGLVTDGAGKPVDDTAYAHSDAYGIERELELKGEGAIDLMPLIVQALNSYDEMTKVLRVTSEYLVRRHRIAATERWDSEDARGLNSEIEFALAKAEGRHD